MHFASDMMNLRHEIDALHPERRKMVDRLHRFGPHIAVRHREDALGHA